MKIQLKFGGDNSMCSHILCSGTPWIRISRNFIIMNIFYLSIEKFMLINPLVRVINSALVTSLLFDFLHFAFKSFACFTARFLVSNRRKRNVTRRACKIKRKKTEPFFQCGWASFLAVLKEGNFKKFIFAMSFSSFL